MSPDLHHLSGAYAVDALDEAERESFERHLTQCPDCRAEVAELSDTAHLLSSLTEATPPPALRDSVLQGITRVRPLPPLVDQGGTSSAVTTSPSSGPGAEAPALEPAAREDAVAPDSLSDAETPGSEPEARPASGGEGRRPRSNVVPLHRRASTWFAAAAAAVVLAAGGVAWGPWSDPASPLDQVLSAADATSVKQSEGSTTAQVAYSRDLGKGAISVEGMPPAPAGKTYQVWYIGADGAARSAGLMAPDSSGEGSMVLEGDPAGAAKVGVTLEPAGGSATPTTPPLMVMSIA
jgi:anti-sigma-K factor RskA